MRPLDDFFSHYFRRNPVNATFTGVHEYDTQLPEWSPDGLASAASEMQALHSGLGAELAGGSGPAATDADLARGYLEIRLAEDQGTHGVRGNPALWTGEAVFGPISLMLRPSVPMRIRAERVSARLAHVPTFLGWAREALRGRPIPAPWIARALRDCQGAQALCGDGIAWWLRWLPRASLPNAYAGPGDRLVAQVQESAALAAAAFHEFAAWLKAQPSADAGALGCGDDFFSLLLSRGHFVERSRRDLLAEARDGLTAARAQLDGAVKGLGGTWAATQDRLAAAHPAQSDFLVAFERTWAQCRQRAERLDLVTWPDVPLRYVWQPDWARDVAPHLYFLPYRSPAPDDEVRAHTYLVPPISETDPVAHLRSWNHATIKLNHVVHHGGIGHHVQNAHAYLQTRSRIGRFAAVDCANRIGMFCGGTMAEGWACYATALMEEAGFLTPLERVAEQHSRVRFLARAVVDTSLHGGEMSFDDAVACYMNEAQMPAAVAHAEATKNSAFPGTGIMYWLGMQQIFELRDSVRQREGAGFSMRVFHDELLSHGSIPVAVAARHMLAGAS